MKEYFFWSGGVAEWLSAHLRERIRAIHHYRIVMGMTRKGIMINEHWFCGEVAEWSIAPVLKTGVRETVPGVRIPPSPQSAVFMLFDSVIALDPTPSALERNSEQSCPLVCASGSAQSACGYDAEKPECGKPYRGFAQAFAGRPAYVGRIPPFPQK
jgi:hypothetical protein